MAGKITIDTERCKGCGLCVSVCPRSCIVVSKKSNKSGYFPAEPANRDSFDKLTTSCTGCAMCALICPEAIITVYSQNNIVEKPAKKNKSRLTEEKVRENH
jgi:2-oxoglutarate ferredoxin oxidoreductase subunit delta